MKKHLMTIDDLYDYYLNQNTNCNFCANDDSDLIVQVNEKMSFDSTYDPTYGMLKTHLKSCHILKNRNGSSISEESMMEAIPSFYNRPILGFIKQLSDGSYDFTSHEFTINEDNEIEYQEIPLGVIPESCHAELVYDEEHDKTYLEVDGWIYEGYTKAADILREKGEASVSVELAVDELEYDASQKALNIKKFHFLGVTILGVSNDKMERKVEPGMIGSNITIADFSSENNSICKDVNYSELLNKIEELNSKIDMLSSLDINTEAKAFESDSKKGGIALKFEELLEKYNKKIEDIDFEYNDMSEEELENKFAELFDDNDEGEDNDDDQDSPESDPSPLSDLDGDDPSDDESKNNIDDEDSNKKTFEEVMVRTYSISHEDIKFALYNLLSVYEQEVNDYFWIEKVYDDRFVACGCNGNYVGCKYDIDETGNVSLSGDFYELHAEYLTKEEKVALDTMRSNYSSICNELEVYKKAEENANKDSLFVNSEYASIFDNEEFKSLKSNHAEYSLNELKVKLDEIQLMAAKNNKFNFANNVKKVNVSSKFVAFGEIKHETNFLDGLLMKK